MPMFDDMYFDQKWSLWDTFNGFARNVRAYLSTAGYRLGNLIGAQNRRRQMVTTQNRRAKIITTGG